MKPSSIFGGLLAVALVSGGWFYGLHWKGQAEGKSSAEESVSSTDFDELQERLSILREENRVLRSLLQGGGDVPVTQEMRAFVEGALNLRFSSSPKVVKATSEQIEEAVKARLRRRYAEGGLALRQRFWSAVGLISQEHNVEAQLVMMESYEARGVLTLDQALVATDFDVESVDDAAVLVQLLAEMLVRSHMSESTAADDDQMWARDAVVAGLVDRVVSAFRVRQARLLVRGVSSPASRDGFTEVLESIAPWLRTLARFKVIRGRSYVDGRLQAGESVVKILQNLPNETAQVFGMNSPRNESKPEGVKHVYRMGQLGFYGLLAEIVDEKSASELAKNWRSDYNLFPDGDKGRFCWLVTLADADSALAAAKPIEDLLASRFPNDPLVPQTFRSAYQVIAKGPKLFVIHAKNQQDLLDYMNELKPIFAE